MIKINNTLITTPSDYTVSINDITKGERNANGKLIVDLIAKKKKIDLEYGMISAIDYKNLLAKVKSTFFFTVEYPDPETNQLNRGTFYVGNIVANGVLYDDTGENITYWRDVSFSFIEQ